MDEITRPLRIAHVTDFHVYGNERVSAAVSSIFRKLEGMENPPELIINTGDAILDANLKSLAGVKAQWEVWKELTSSLTIPLHNSLGNHDIWIPSIQTFLRELNNPLRGKELAMQMLEMEAPYYSFEHGGWKFICLYSMERRYGLGDTQMKWLEQELASAKGPVCIFSHVPILSIGSFMYHLNKKRWWAFPAKEMQKDTFKLQALFKQHPNVKLCLSGHVHYVDDVSYNGVRYLCQGAICGNWWRDEPGNCPAAYAILDLYADGRVEKEVVYY